MLLGFSNHVHIINLLFIDYSKKREQCAKLTL